METSTTQATEEYEYCDLVMKGGITSGVIYPAAAVRLSSKYRFKNIGGTSAGAIAAAVTAAAELGRRTQISLTHLTFSKPPPEDLARNGHLLKLFTPDPYRVERTQTQSYRRDDMNALIVFQDTGYAAGN